MPEFKVSGPPKNGSIITKVGKLKTPASYRCPNKEEVGRDLKPHRLAGRDRLGSVRRGLGQSRPG
jgi:hypothetical protein